MNWDKVEQAIRKAIGEREAHGPEQRARIYAAALAALNRRQDVDDDALSHFDSLTRKIESTYLPEGRKTESRTWRLAGKWNSVRQWLMFAVGAVVGAGGLLFYDAVAVNSVDADKTDALRKRYEATLPQVPVAVKFLHEVADAVIKAQADDRKKLDVTKKFVSLARFDPDLAKKVPSSLPKGSAVMLKADAFNFKILFNWTLCATIRISDPALVDPVRATPNSIGCPYFGLWTPAASGW